MRGSPPAQTTGRKLISPLYKPPQNPATPFSQNSHTFFASSASIAFLLAIDLLAYAVKYCGPDQTVSSHGPLSV